jgi:hypothetical protein
MLSALCKANIINPQPGYETLVPTKSFALSPGYHHALGFRKYLSSFTSYQFPNPFPPNQDPLSRLEFPIDQWFLGIAAGYNAPMWALSGQGWINLTREATRKMQDSDWDDDTMPHQKTIFSESNCRMNRGLLFELQMSFTTPLERWCNLRPLIGYRYDYFYFTTHDGMQRSFSGGEVDLPGDGIDFKQTFQHFYFGGSASGTLNLQRLTTWLSQLDLECQLDYGIAAGHNEDLHLLRSGERITLQLTDGHCWHLVLRAGVFSTASALLGFEAGFTRFMTNGSHALTNRVLNIDFSFGGSKVWSDLAYLSVYGAIKF